MLTIHHSRVDSLRRLRTSMSARTVARAATALLALACSPAVAQVNATLTVDNSYSFGFGTAAGIPPGYFRGETDNGSAGAIFNCEGGPETYLNVPVVTDGYLYVIAWSDNRVTQGVLGQFVPTTGNMLPFYTGNSAWQVFATGNDWYSSPGPSLALINSQILVANANAGGPGSSVGWVGVGNNPANTVGALAIGEDNTPGGNFPEVCTTRIAADARWMWYDPAPGITPDPFRNDVAGEFLIFRLATPQAASPHVVHLSKDIENTLPQAVAGIEMLLAGAAATIADVDLGPMTSFAASPQGGDTVLRWTGGTIQHSQIAHVGLTLLQSSMLIRGVWLLDQAGYRIGCVHQVNGDMAMSSAGGSVTFANTVTDCESLSLYAGFIDVEWYGNEVPLEQMKLGVARSPIRTDHQPISAVQLAAGGRSTLAMPAPPVGGNYALLSYRVGTSSSLTSRVTRDWYQFTTSELLDRIPAGLPLEYGKGCPASGALYEQYLGQGSFGLAGRSLRFTPTNGDYTVSAGGGFDASYQPTDAMAVGNNGTLSALSFGAMGSFPYGYRNWTSVDANAAGMLLFRSGADPVPTPPSLAFFLGQSPVIAAAWSTWRMQYGGGFGAFYWTTTPAFCMATWADVRASSSTFAPSTFQAKLFANGVIELNYGSTVDPDFRSGSNVIVGLSMGNGAPVGGVHLANALLAPITGYVGAPGMRHQVSGPPRFGSMVELSCSNVPAGSLGGVFVIGFTPYDPGIDLAPLGMPLCAAHVSFDLLNFGALNGNTLTYGLAVPFAPDLAGLVYYSQALSVTPGRNAFGGFTSNAVNSGEIGW